MKVMKIISSEYDAISKEQSISNRDRERVKKDLGLLSAGRLNKIDIAVIKEVRDFFASYIPPQYVELITINYLQAFSDFVNDFAIRSSKKKSGIYLPEIVDTSKNGGGYGLPNAWLQLLKCCTPYTENNHLSIVAFLNHIVDILPDSRFVACRPEFKNCQQALEQGILKHLRYSKLTNPQFVSKNNANDVVRYLEEIERTLKEQGRMLPSDNLRAYKKRFKQEIDDGRLL